MPIRKRRFRSCLLLALLVITCGSLLPAGYLLAPPDAVTIAILGLDARPGEGDQTHTDSVMLLNVSPEHRRVTVLSIPRDVFIMVPGVGERRINTINVIGEQRTPGGGPWLVTASLEASFGLPVDHYIRLDFRAFVELVDAVGGVEIDVPAAIIDTHYPTPDRGTMALHFAPGKQHMDGERALQYARTRHQDDDFHRAARQQQVLDAVVQKMTNPRYWLPVWRALHRYTDTDLTRWDMFKIGPAALWGWSAREHRVLQGADLIEVRGGYWIPDYDRIIPWIDAHFGAR